MPKHRYTQSKTAWVPTGARIAEGGAREDDALGANSYEGVHESRVDLAVDLRFAHPARDELSVLGPEVEESESVVQRFAIHGAGAWHLIETVIGAS